MKTFVTHLLAVAAWAVLTPAVQAQSINAPVFTNLHNFDALTNGTNLGGAFPTGGLVLGHNGHFYGVTTGGGTGGDGTIYGITPTGQLEGLFNFPAGGAAGSAPTAGLALDKKGNLVGTTSGDSTTPPTVFTFSTDNILHTLYTFTGAGASEASHATLAQYDPGVYYGTTPFGVGGNTGTGSGDSGLIYSITSDGTYTIVHTFSDTDQNYENSDGASPTGGLVYSAFDGAFFGTATDGGTNATGTAFKITPDGVFTTLYSFSATDNHDSNADGAYPTAALVLGRDDALYGTTYSGGTNGNGTVFRITPGGKFTTLYSFSGVDANHANNDGAFPNAALLSATDGNLYGTTLRGGLSDKGTIFQITLDGTLTPLHSFSDTDANLTNLDGATPDAPLVQGRDGKLYGTTLAGGTGGGGTIFSLDAGLPLNQPAFFLGQTPLPDNAYYLSFPNGNYFGYYAFLPDPNVIFHFDLGYEYILDYQDDQNGIYLYDFASDTFFYTSPIFPFPYLYDFTLNSVVYYYPDPDPMDAGHYDTNGVRYFYVYNTGQIISK